MPRNYKSMDALLKPDERFQSKLAMKVWSAISASVVIPILAFK